MDRSIWHAAYAGMAQWQYGIWRDGTDSRVENVTVAAPAVISKSIFTRAGS